jgi:hypothetical protein
VNVSSVLSPAAPDSPAPGQSDDLNYLSTLLLAVIAVRQCLMDKMPRVPYCLFMDKIFLFMIWWLLCLMVFEKKKIFGYSFDTTCVVFFMVSVPLVLWNVDFSNGLTTGRLDKYFVVRIVKRVFDSLSKMIMYPSNEFFLDCIFIYSFPIGILCFLISTYRGLPYPDFLSTFFNHIFEMVGRDSKMTCPK